MSASDSYMHLAIESAREGALQSEGGPFGACIVCDGRVVAVSHNTVLKSKDPTCHAEINAIRAASKELDSHILSDCEIYATSEPCPMCLAAIYWARIVKIHIGVTRRIATAYGFDDSRFYQELAISTETRKIPISIGLLEKECTQLFEEWKKVGGKVY